MEGSELKEFAQNCIQGFLVFRADEVLFANGALTTIHGFKNPSDLAAGGLAALIAPQERKRIAPYGRVSRKGKALPRHLELEALRRDGSPILVEWLVTPMDWEGRAAMQATVVDISDRLQMEGQLKESEERYRGLMEQASDGIFLSTPEGKYVDVNTQGLEMTGYSREELLSLSLSDLTDPAERAELPARVKNLKKNKQLLLERMLRRKDGSLFPAEISAKILKNGNILGIVRDVTERSRAAEALSSSERLLQTVFDAIPQPIAVKDTKGRLLKVNRAFSKFLPHPPETYLGKVATGIPIESWEMVKISARTDREVLKTGKRVNVPEFRITLPSGEERIRVGVKLPLPDKQGKTVGIVAMMEDITRHRQTEQALRASEQRLADAIESLPGGFALFDAEDRLVLFNQRFKDIYPHHGGTVAFGIRFEDLVRIGVERGEFPEALGREEEWIAERMEIHLNPTGPVEQLLKDGRWLRIEERRTSEGGIVGLRTDITELKQVEQALRASEQRLEDAIESIPEGFALFDAEDRLVLSNQRFREIYPHQSDVVTPGTRFENMLRMGVKRGVHPDAIGREEEWIAERLHTHANPTGPLEQPLGDGRWLRVEERHTTEGGIVGLRTDITELKRTAMALRASERLLQAVFDALPVGVSVKDTNFRFMMVNETFSLWTQRPIAEILGRTTKEVGRGTQEQILSRFQSDRQVLKTAERIELPEEPLTNLNGEVRWRQFVKAPWFGEDGKVAGVVSTVTDITELKRAEQAVRASERLLQTVFDAIPVGVFVKDLEARFIMVNEAFSQLVDMPMAEIIGKNNDEFDIGTKEEILARKERDQRVLGTGGRLETPEQTVTLANGEVQWRHMVRVPLYGEKGEISGIVGMTMDITRRKQMEMTLRASERLMQTVFNAIPVGVSVKDRESRYLIVNETFSKMTGWPIHEIIGKTTGDIGRGTREQIRSREETDRRVLETGVGMELLEEPITYSEGDIRWRHMVKAPLFDEEGEVSGIVSTLLDITQRKQAEQALRDRERLLQAIFESMPMGVFVKDRETRFLMVNRAFSQTIGLPIESIIGKKTGELNIGTVDEISHRVETDRQVLKTGMTIDSPETPITHPGKEVVWRHLVKVPLRDESGEIIGIISTQWDITERVHAVEALRESEQLLQTVFDAMPQSIAVKDREGRFLKVNQAFVGTLGMRPEKYLGKAPQDLLERPVELRALLAGSDQAVVETGGRVEIPEHTILNAAGETRTRTGTKLPLWDKAGNISGIVAVFQDVTERVRAEEELREGQRLLQTVFDTTPVGLSVKDRQGRYVMVNRAFADFMETTPEAMVGQKFEDSSPWNEEDAKNSVARDRLVMEQGQRVEAADHTYVFPDGKVKWRRSIKAPLVDKNGQIVGLVGVRDDITDRKKGEQALAASQRLLDTIFDAMPQWIYVKDREHKLLMVNRAYAEDHGMTRESLEGRHSKDVPRGEGIDYTPFIKMDDQVMHGKGEVISSPQIVVLPDGRRQVRQYVRAPLKDEKDLPVGVVVVTEDQTERVAAEEALRESRRLLQTVFNTTPVGVAVKDRQGRYVMVNRTFADFTGEEPEEMIGHTIGELGHAAQEQLELIEQRDRRVMQKGERIESTDMPYTFPDGTVKWQRATKAPLMDEQGKIIGLVAVRHDITELKQTELAVLQTQKLESLGVLAGGVAHDFNNILVAILGNAGLALMRLPDGSPAREEIRQIEIAGERAAELCRQMLNYSGKGKLAMESINLNKLVEEITHLLQVSISRNIVLNYNLGKSTPTVTGDPGQIQQVLMNLVINASEAILDQSGMVSMATGTTLGNSELAAGPFVGGATLNPERSYAFVEVSDSGTGMDDATLHKIFDPFFTTKFTGRGLGLAAVMGIVRAHGGVMHVSSEPGEGTTFRFILPATEPPPTAKGSQPGEQPWKGSGLVLVIDDEEPVRAVTARMLEMVGFTIVTAGDGRSGVEIFRTRREEFAAILLDLTMPRQGGEETLALLYAFAFMMSI